MKINIIDKNTEIDTLSETWCTWCIKISIILYYTLEA